MVLSGGDGHGMLQGRMAPVLLHVQRAMPAGHRTSASGVRHGRDGILLLGGIMEKLKLPEILFQLTKPLVQYGWRLCVKYF